jgi:hypothetical protein
MSGMNCRTPRLVASLCIWFCVALNANGETQPSPDRQGAPTLQVLIYGFPELPPGVLQGAEAEATRLLRAVPIRWRWVNCRGGAIACDPQPGPTDLTIRVVRSALPSVSERALGAASPSAEGMAAFLFYDRILALRTQTCWLPAMLGRVLAHEMTHLLMMGEEHAGFGLMRKQWRAEDLRWPSTACIGLSAESIRIMHDEALRRVRLARSTSGH